MNIESVFLLFKLFEGVLLLKEVNLIIMQLNLKFLVFEERIKLTIICIQDIFILIEFICVCGSQNKIIYVLYNDKIFKKNSKTFRFLKQH